MKQITDFAKVSKAEFNDLRSDIEKALEKVAAGYGVTFKALNASYLGGEATIKLQIVAKGGKTRAAIEFEQLAESYGLKASDLNRSFEADGKTFTVIGLNQRKAKQPIILQGSDGKQYNGGEAWVARKLHPLPPPTSKPIHTAR